MHTIANIQIAAAPSAVWGIVTDPERVVEVVTAIDEIEILEAAPAEGLVGLSWRETRTMFGKSASEDMTVTDATENQHFTTHAASHGAIYTSTWRLAATDTGCTVTVDFTSEGTSFMGKVMGAVFGVMMKRSMEKAFQADLQEIKAAAEAAS